MKKKTLPKKQKMMNGGKTYSLPQKSNNASASIIRTPDLSGSNVNGKNQYSPGLPDSPKDYKNETAIASAALSSASDLVRATGNPEKVNVAADAMKGAAAGASVGAVAGPYGALIGAAVGGTVAGVGSTIKKKKIARDFERKRQDNVKQTGELVKNLKYDTTDVFSTKNSDYNSASVTADGMINGLAEGGKVKGPGGPKEDKIDTSLPSGSIVVPAENEQAAAMIRKAFLPKKTGKMKSSGGSAVNLSNGEHVFTPEEKMQIDSALIAKKQDPKTLWNALIPNPSEDNALSTGGEVDSDRKKMPASEFKKKYGISFYEYDNGKRPEAKKPTPKQEKKVYIPIGGQYGLPGGIEVTQSEYDKAYKQWKESEDKKSANKKNTYDQVTGAVVDIKRSLNEVNKRYVDKYAEYGITGPEVFSLTKKEQEKRGIPQDILTDYWNEYSKLKKQYDDGISAMANIKKINNTKDPLDSNDFSVQADQMASSYLKSIGKSDEVIKKGATNTASTVQAVKENKPIDQSIDDNIAKAEGLLKELGAPTTNVKSTTSTSGKKKPVDVSSIKPIMAPERPLAEELATLPPDQPAPSANQPGVNTTQAKTADAMAATPASTSTGAPPPPDEPKIDAFDILAIGQTISGFLADPGKRPEDKLDPLLSHRVAASIANADKAEEAAKTGFSTKTKQSILSGIENTRRQTMSNVVQTTSGNAGTSSALRMISQDKNKSIVDMEVASEQLRQQKLGRADALNSQADAMVAGLDARKRTIFEDDQNEYWKQSEAAADLINAGMSNYFQNQERKEMEKRRKKRQTEQAV